MRDLPEAFALAGWSEMPKVRRKSSALYEEVSEMAMSKLSIPVLSYGGDHLPPVQDRFAQMVCGYLDDVPLTERY